MNTDKKELTLLQVMYNTATGLYRETNTIEQYFEKYEYIKSKEADLKEYLKSKKVLNLRGILQNLGEYTDSSQRKPDLIDKVYSSFISLFYVGRMLSYSFGETWKGAEVKMIEETTAQDLQTFYDKRARKAKEKAKAESNPETLEEFRIFIAAHGVEALSDEQKEARQRLTADTQIGHNKAREEQQNEVAKVDIQNAEFEIHETKHSKTGDDIFTVIMTERVDKDTFIELRKKSKQFGGYYSRYTDRNASPPIKAGFNFSNKEDAQQFMGLTEQDQSTTDRKEDRAEEVKGNAVERMRTRAKNMRERAEESLNQDRKTNTHKRAGEAGRAEEKARAEISFSKKMDKIADGLEDGTIKYLEKMTNGKQLEQLQRILLLGYWDRVPYAERNKEERNFSLDVNFVKYPFPKYGTDVIVSVFKDYIETPGMKQDIKRLYRSANAGKKDGYFELKGEYIINLFKKTANKIKGDKWAKERILDPIRDFERLQNMGITTLAILQMCLRELGSLSEGTGMTEEQKNEKELKELERSFIGKKIAGFFPTPKPLVEKMFDMARVFEGETVLEPSAGLGHIAEQIKAKYPQNDLSVIEFNYDLSRVLEKKGFNVEHENFLNTTHKYDVIFMNPPFENHQDIDHVKHAFSLLNEGGRIVAIMAGNKEGQGKTVTEFREFVSNNGGYMVENEAGSFKSAFNSTGVNTTTVYIEKARTTEEAEEEEQEESTPEPIVEAEVQTKSEEGGQMLLF